MSKLLKQLLRTSSNYKMPQSLLLSASKHLSNPVNKKDPDKWPVQTVEVLLTDYQDQMTDHPNCWAWGRNCNNCGIANHFASACWKPAKQPSTINNIDSIAHLHYDKTNDTYSSPSSHTNEISATVQAQINVNPKLQSTKMLIFSECGASICPDNPQHLK